MRCDVYGWQRCSLLANSLFRYFISIGIIATVRIFSLDVWLIELILVHKHVWSEDLLRLWISDWEFKHCRLVRRTSVGFIIQTCIWFFIEALTVLAPATCIRLFSASWHGFAISRFGRTIICFSFILLGLLLLAFIDQLFLGTLKKVKLPFWKLRQQLWLLISACSISGGLLRSFKFGSTVLEPYADFVGVDFEYFWQSVNDVHVRIVGPFERSF